MSGLLIDTINFSFFCKVARTDVSFILKKDKIFTTLCFEIPPDKANYTQVFMALSALLEHKEECMYKYRMQLKILKPVIEQENRIYLKLDAKLSSLRKPDLFEFTKQIEKLMVYLKGLCNEHLAISTTFDPPFCY